MELLKPDVKIDEAFKPDKALDYNQYFSRAMLFAQTNYQPELSKMANVSFKRVSAAGFFEEYVWTICNINSSIKVVATYFPQLIYELKPYYYSFADREFPNQELMREYVTTLVGSPVKFEAISRGAQIINQAVKLFGWEQYRSNFLDTAEKLRAFPLIDKERAHSLAYNIGLSNELFHDTAMLKVMAMHWGFGSTPGAVVDMCKAIGRQYVMQPRVIALVLWLSGVTFGFS